MAVMIGRERELALLAGIRGAAMVVLGECGMGKTVLLDAVPQAGSRVLRTAGVEAEAELPMAGLHRLVQPLRVPELSPDPFAFHRLLVEAARDCPLLCLVDDVHLMDFASVRALTFAARRLDGEPVRMVLAADAPGELLAGIPSITLQPLDPIASRQVLADRVPSGMPDDLADDLVELAGGNPLALFELAGALTAEQLSGEAPGAEALPPGSRLRDVLRRRLLALSEPARRLVLLAVVDEGLDIGTVLRAADTGIELAAVDDAVSSGLVRVDGERITVPGALIRSTLCAEAPLAHRRAAHRLLARILDPEQEPVRWTWQRVALAGGPAEELDDAAAIARHTGDYLASSRAYRQAAALTAQPEAKALRLIAAATDYSLAGRARHARALLRQARPLATTGELRGLSDLLHGQIELRDGLPLLAHQTLLGAATELIGTHRTLAVTALMLAAEASCLAGSYQHHLVVAQRAAALRGPDETPAGRLMFDHLAGMAATYAGRHAHAVAPLRNVLRLAEIVEHPMSTIWASEAAYTLGDAVRAQELATRAVNTARAARFPVLLPWALVYLSMSALLHDRHRTALSSSLEGMRVAGAIGARNGVVDHLMILALLAALLGDRETALLRLEAGEPGARTRGLGRPSALSSWAAACADLATDRPADAMDRLRLMAAGTGYMHPAIRAMAAPHFVEAAVRCGERAKAAQALESFDHWANATGSTPRLAQAHRCHALLAGDTASAEAHFREAIRLHRASNTALELAKTELLYAHQLRRTRKPRAARDQLRDALKIFQQYDAELWAERTRAELRAAGETVARNGSGPGATLTPQQEQIARLVAQGATNREIAAHLVVSPRTVDHHLRNIFAKLGVRSRVELAAMFR